MKLRRMYQSLGWSRADCAQFLHVCERTLHNWERGKHDVPYAAFRLLRITCGMALPGQAWRGWSLHGGKLWTPEGVGIDPQTAFWWALLVRRAETGSKALRALHEAKARPSAGCQAGARPSRGREGGPACGDASRSAMGAPARLGQRDVLVTRHFSPAGRIADRTPETPQIQHWRGFQADWRLKDGF
ncbi:hypothetical protein EII20_10665 [Comamonadaceae bacterium OH2545_COT-014]|nr:hypothetical protein EII20_10665 [Comamonadaceae bacterium OH2545_COT-014]